MRTILLALLVSSASLTACVQTEDLDATETVDDGKLDDPANKPLGTYADPFLALDSVPAGTKFPLISMLVLRSNGTFLRTQVLGCIGTNACDRSEEEGAFKYTKSGTKRFVRFTDKDGNLIDRWQYEVSAGKLKMRPAGATTWQPLPKSEVAFCTAPVECTQQGIPQPRCPDAWSCENNACTPACGGDEPPANACVAAGGSCIGLVPGACSDGVVLDPMEYSCGGPVGVLCCL